MVIGPVYARITNPAGPAFDPDDVGGSFSSIISVVITLLFTAGIIVSFLHFIIGAWRWIGAKGDKGALQEAQQTIINSLVGLVILFSVYAILSLLGQAFEIDLIRPVIPSIVGS